MGTPLVREVLVVVEIFVFVGRLVGVLVCATPIAVKVVVGVGRDVVYSGEEFSVEVTEEEGLVERDDEVTGEGMG
jgi:hypothetical protein